MLKPVVLFSNDLTVQSFSPTGKQVTWTETVIDRIVDGKIVKNWFNENALDRL